MTVARLAKHLVEEELSNTKLRKQLREERAMHLRIKTEKDDELLQLRTQIAKLEDRLKSALAGKKKGWSGRFKQVARKKVARTRKVIDSSD